MKTPYYLYDLKLLEKTLQELVFESNNYLIHYAIKANTDERINNIIASYGLGADCVSGNEIKHAIKCGFKAESIVFAGVGKTDQEIEIGPMAGKWNVIHWLETNGFESNDSNIQKLLSAAKQSDRLLQTDELKHLLLN